MGMMTGAVVHGGMHAVIELFLIGITNALTYASTNAITNACVCLDPSDGTIVRCH